MLWFYNLFEILTTNVTIFGDDVVDSMVNFFADGTGELFCSSNLVGFKVVVTSFDFEDFNVERGN